MPTFSIVIPVYNEASFLPIGLPRLLAQLDEAELDYRILIMENGSTDGSAAVARGAGRRCGWKYRVVTALRQP